MVINIFVYSDHKRMLFNTNNLTVFDIFIHYIINIRRIRKSIKADFNELILKPV